MQKIKNIYHLAHGNLTNLVYGSPSKQLKLVGVTGTNGKTTVATLLYELLTEIKIRAGLFSTIKYMVAEKKINSSLTTPDVVKINKLLRRMIDSDCKACFMEASSHAIDQNRIAGLHYSGAIFTNISRDHLDYHGTFENYVKAKKKFFDKLDPKAFAVVNVDDKNGNRMLKNTKAKKRTYSLDKSGSDFKGDILEDTFKGLKLNVNGQEFTSKLIGTHNAYNLLAIYGTAISLGIKKEKILEAIPKIEPAKGRFEVIPSEKGIIGIVDYAHTPDALENVLKAIHRVKQQDQRVIVLAGCGGDRDRGKRPMMAKIGNKYGDRLVLTSDNPRTEVPGDIIKDMKDGLSEAELSETIIEEDRKAAIIRGVKEADSNDIVLVAGKGHEDYQEVNGVKHHFDDAEMLVEAYNSLSK